MSAIERLALLVAALFLCLPATLIPLTAMRAYRIRPWEVSRLVLVWRSASPELRFGVVLLALRYSGMLTIGAYFLSASIGAEESWLLKFGIALTLTSGMLQVAVQIGRGVVRTAIWATRRRHV